MKKEPIIILFVIVSLANSGTIICDKKTTFLHADISGIEWKAVTVS